MSKNSETVILEPAVRGGRIEKMQNPSTELKGLLSNQEFYTAKVGETYIFDENNVEYRKWYNEGAKNPCVLVMCMIKRGSADPVQSWFNLNTFKKVDIHRNPVYPELYQLNAEELMAKLFEVKELTCTGTKPIQTQKFVKGEAQYENIINEAGQIIANPVAKKSDAPVFDKL